MTKMRWPPPRNPRPKAAARVASQIMEADKARAVRRQATMGEDKAVLSAMPNDALGIASVTGLSIDRVGAALSRLKAAGRANKDGRKWVAQTWTT